MGKIWQWLRQPYPYDGSWRHQLRVGVYAGLFVTLFLYLFRPFGLGTRPFSEWWLARQCIYFGLATMVTAWLFGGLRKLFPSYCNEQDWIVSRELLSNLGLIIFITFANLLLGHWLYDNPLNGTSLGFAFRNTLLIGLFPVVFSAYVHQQRSNQQYVQSAQEANALLSETSSTQQSLSVRLTGSNRNEELNFDAQDLLFIEAADNYAKVYLWRSEQLEKHLLRASLKSLAEQLSDHLQFFRCHRTYLVNLKQVSEISGNAQGYKLHLFHTDQIVPVSRKLNAEIDKRLPDL